MRNLILFTVLMLFVIAAHAQQQNNQEQQTQQRQQRQQRWSPESTEWYYPVPPKVKPGINAAPPSDAIVLFDGTDLSKWESRGWGPG